MRHGRCIRHRVASHPAESAGWRPLYEQEREDLCVSRLKWAVGLTLLGTAVLIAQIVDLSLPDPAYRIGIALGYGVSGLIAVAVTSLPRGRRYAYGVTVGFVFAIVLIMACSF